MLKEDVPVCGFSCNALFFDVNLNPADGCECEYLSDSDFPDLGAGGTPVDANCDGVDGELENGVFVAKNGDDSGAGTIDSPVLTIDATPNSRPRRGKGMSMWPRCVSGVPVPD